MPLVPNFGQNDKQVRHKWQLDTQSISKSWVLVTVVSMQRSTTLSQNMQICLQILFQVLEICTHRLCNKSADVHSQGSGFEERWVWGGCPFSQDASAKSFWDFSGTATSEDTTVVAYTLIQQANGLYVLLKHHGPALQCWWCFFVFFSGEWGGGGV